MDQDIFYRIDIARFRRSFPIADSVGIGDDFCVLDMRYDKCLDVLVHPCRLDAYLAFFCISGRLRMSINLHEFEIKENSLVMNIPGDILRVPEMPEDEKKGLHFIVVAMSRPYVSELNIDIDKLFSEGMFLLDNPGVTLSDEERTVASGYLTLARNILTSSLPYKRECIRSLLSSVFYMAAGVLSRHISEARRLKGGAASGRGKQVFDNFIRLVSEHHMSERSVGFYASALCLTPKYLSKLVRKTSGRSAPEWIDAFVILEAKSMLRYSDMNVKEIVARLNFPDQSSFYKFFRARTGMTPRQYRKM